MDDKLRDAAQAYLDAVAANDGGPQAAWRVMLAEYHLRQAYLCAGSVTIPWGAPKQRIARAILEETDGQ